MSSDKTVNYPLLMVLLYVRHISPPFHFKDEKNGKSFTGKEKIKILLLEGLHPSSVEVLQAAGYSNIEYHKGSLPEEELIEAVKDVHFIGIRSRTNLSEEVINAANKLVAIGCFCIGTNQVDLSAAASRGIPVFNAPFSNTRSVAELVLGQILLLLRGIPERTR